MIDYAQLSDTERMETWYFLLTGGADADLYLIGTYTAGTLIDHSEMFWRGPYLISAEIFDLIERAGAQVRDALTTLSGDDRLDATEIKGLPAVQAGIKRVILIPSTFDEPLLYLTHDSYQISSTAEDRTLTAGDVAGFYGYSDGTAYPYTTGSISGDDTPIALLGSYSRDKKWIGCCQF